ncbi:MAG: sigma-54 dependent transcriptional regulator [Proteobacteria bacterium]|nr:sigma-54 dependent transcriptional regulator [Pseudomonadota bacterium]
MSQEGHLKILIVDDEISICEGLAGILTDEGHKTRTCTSGRDALIEYKVMRPDMVFLDIWMPGMDGIQTLQAMREIDSNIPILIMSGHATIETAVKATKLGAHEVLEKPLELERILALLQNILELKRKGDASAKGQLELVGDSQFVQNMKRQVAVVGPRNAWVLITGENGTGKEVVARMIHNSSPRSKHNFVAVNCAAIPEELIESELFGHEKGAFTSAVTVRKGKFELAHQGTIFLDEIGDMSLRTQAKILRILQEKVFERVGGQQSMDADVRVVAATNKDLVEEIRQGRFREDLYYILNVIPLKMVPLRDRPEDILPLARHFLAVLKDEKQSEITLSDFAEKILMGHDWPGNVRELKNALERAVVMSDGKTISASDFTWLSQGAESEQTKKVAVSLKAAKSDFERNYILDKLEENEWNVTRTADMLGIERSNLHRKLRSYDIDLQKLKG